MNFLFARPRQSALLLCAGFAVLSGCDGDSTGFNLELQPARIQARLNEQFPKESCPTQLMCVGAHTPQLALTNGSQRIGLRIQLSARSPLVKTAPSDVGMALVSAKLRYERTEAALYLDDVKIDSMQLRGVPDAVSKLASDMSPQLIGGSFSSKPIYQIPSDRLTERMQRLVLKDVYVHDGKLRVSIGF